MSSMEMHDIAFNLILYKWTGLFYIFESTNKKIFNYHIYRFIYVFVSLINTTIIFFGLSGFFVKLETSIDTTESIMNIFVVMMGFSTLLKLNIFIYKAKDTWNLLDVTRIHFLSSKYCQKHIQKLEKCKNRLIKLTNFTAGQLILLFIIYLINPLITNSNTLASGTANRRLLNILNMQFSVSTNTYNQYYYVFYAIEATIASFGAYSIIIDTFLLSVIVVIICQYEILAEAFEDIGFQDKKQNDAQKYKGFMSVLIDQRELNLKLKSFYSIVRIIVLLNVIFISSSIVIETFILIVICTSTKPYAILKVLQITGSILIMRESVTYRIFACNWTAKSLIFKKLILLTLCMNDANRFTIKATPTKMINLQFFVNVMIKSYNILMVMLNKNKIIQS